MKKLKTVCFLGEMQNCADALCRKIYSQADLLASEPCGFIFSADSKFGLICARQIILRRNKQRGNSVDLIRLVAVVPYEEHINSRSEEFRDEYFEVLTCCDSVLTFAYERADFIESDYIQAIIDISDVIFLADKTEYAFLYATAKGKKIIRIP